MLIPELINFNACFQDFLFKFGRANIPVNLMYPADPSEPPIILSEVLTQSIMLEALDMASGKKG